MAWELPIFGVIHWPWPCSPEIHPWQVSAKPFGPIYIFSDSCQSIFSVYLTNINIDKYMYNKLCICCCWPIDTNLTQLIGRDSTCFVMFRNFMNFCYAVLQNGTISIKCYFCGYCRSKHSCYPYLNVRSAHLDITWYWYTWPHIKGI